MPMSRKAKERLLDKLLQAKRKGTQLEVRLRFQGRDAEADEVGMRNRKLSRRIDELLGRFMDDWLGTAATLEEELSGTNRKLQDALRDVKKRVKVADRVIKAVGLLDDVLGFAGKLLR